VTVSTSGPTIYGGPFGDPPPAATKMSCEQLVREKALHHAVTFAYGLNIAFAGKNGVEPMKGAAVLTLAETYRAYIESGALPDPAVNGG